MNTPTEDKFRDVYAVYERNHAEQRATMLAALQPTMPVTRGWKLRLAAAALAAVLIVGLGIAGVVSLRPTPAFGLDGVRERLQSLNSLHIKGFIYHRTTTPFGVATLRFPTECYYQRPSRSFHTSYGFSSQGDDNLVKVTRSYSVSDGQRSLAVLHDEKKAVLTSPLDPLQTELSMECSLQVSETGKLVSEHPEDFERVGTERVDGNWCDIYQSKPAHDFGYWRRIWVDPSKELPVRAMEFRRISNGEDELQYEDTEIHANVDPPPELFTFEVPDGYEFTEVKNDLKTRYLPQNGQGSAGNRSVAEWVALNIDDRAVLVCWSEWLKDKDKQVFFHDAPRLVLEGNPDRLCTDQMLYETMSGVIRWRWSLIMPDDNKPLGKKSLMIKFRHPQGSNSLAVYPLVFSEPRLSEMVEKVQRRSLEAGGDFSAVKSLKQLRDVIANGPKASQP
jgi:outer membrane lipoprotein-sorting protein